MKIDQLQKKIGPIAEDIEYDEPRIYHGIENNVREYLVTDRIADHLIGTDIIANGINVIRGGDF